MRLFYFKRVARRALTTLHFVPADSVTYFGGASTTPTLVDTTNFTETLVKIVTRHLSETVGLTENLVRSVVIRLNLSDTLVLSDALAAVKSGLADTLGLTETLTKVVTHRITETFQPTEALITGSGTIRPSGIVSGFDADNPTVGADVGTINEYGIASEEAFAPTVTSGGVTVSGGLTLSTPTNPTPPAPGTITAKKLCSPLDLVTASLYNTAPNPADILPEVYGDFSAGGLRGPIPAVLVTQSTPWIFIAAMHPVQSIDAVYIDDVQQTTGYTTTPAIFLGGGPQVAIIVFADQPTGVVSWRGKGKRDGGGTGVLIEDPILQLEDLLMTRAGYSSSDFDATTLAEAKSLSATTGWTTAFVVNDTAQVQSWITEILFNCMGFWRVSGRAQLQIMLDPGGSAPESDLVDSVIASRDCIDGDDGVTFVADRQQLVNQLVIDYDYSWSESQYTAQLLDDTVKDALSFYAHGEIRKGVTLRGHRDPLQLAIWADIVFERQAFTTRVEGAQITFSVKGPRLIHVTVGDLIAFSWPYGPTRELGHAYVNEILRVVSISHDFSRGGMSSVMAIDTGTYVTRLGTRLLTPLAL